MGTSEDKETMEKAFNQAARNLMWPVLTRTNYQEWSSHIQCNLEAMFLWDAVTDNKIERRRDRLALGAMLRGVPPEMHPMLLNKKTVKEAWEAIKSMRLGQIVLRQSMPRSCWRSLSRSPSRLEKRSRTSLYASPR
jgi:hypothetical protein